MSIQLQIDGEEVQVTGRMQCLVRSKSNPDDWYAVDLEERWSPTHDPGVCTCKGFEVRKHCRHVEAMRRFARGEAQVKVKETENASA